MEPSERCAIWRSCELILRLLPCVCVRESVCIHCAGEKRGGACAQGGPCGCVSGSSAAMLLKSGTGRSLRLTLAKVFAGCKVWFLTSHKLGLLSRAVSLMLPLYLLEQMARIAPQHLSVDSGSGCLSVGKTGRQVTGLWPVTEGLSPEGESELARSREGPWHRTRGNDRQAGEVQLLLLLLRSYLRLKFKL